MLIEFIIQEPYQRRHTDQHSSTSTVQVRIKTSYTRGVKSGYGKTLYRRYGQAIVKTPLSHASINVTCQRHRVGLCYVEC